MPRWEYKHSSLAVEAGKSFDLDPVADEWADHCTELGLDGWELISYEYRAAKGDRDRDGKLRVYYSGMFKRDASVVRDGPGGARLA